MAQSSSPLKLRLNIIEKMHLFHSKLEGVYNKFNLPSNVSKFISSIWIFLTNEAKVMCVFKLDTRPLFSFQKDWNENDNIFKKRRNITVVVWRFEWNKMRIFLIKCIAVIFIPKLWSVKNFIYKLQRRRFQNYLFLTDVWHI